jgi:hypothetical protein
MKAWEESKRVGEEQIHVSYGTCTHDPGHKARSHALVPAIRFSLPDRILMPKSSLTLQSRLPEK